MPRDWRPYTHKEMETIRELSRTLTDAAIAKRLGRPVGGVQRKRWRMGFVDYVLKDPARDAEVCRLARDGWWDKEIAAHMGFNNHSVAFRIRRRHSVQAGKFARSFARRPAELATA